MDPVAATKRRRTKKVDGVAPVNEFHVVTPEQATEAEAAKPEHIILHLRTAAKAPEDAPSNEVLGYQEHNNFNSEPSMYAAPASDCDVHSDLLSDDVKVVMPNLVMNDIWPTHVNSACFWCAHKFSNAPVGLPVKIKESKLHTCGCFCSMECAAAFNFNCTELGQNKWHSYQLLNRLARKLGCTDIVKQAPSRFSLKLFGGWMEIAEFRSTNRTIAVLPHPMVSVVQYMEEIIPTDMVKKPSCFVPLDNDRVQKAKHNILVSTKSKKNTIQNKMKLVV